MRSASSRISVRDLTHRPGRTALSVLTLALAVASISFFAVPPLIDTAMQREVRASRLADVRLTMSPVALTDEQLAALEDVANVEAVEPRTAVDVRVLIGERRAPARVFGVRDLGDQGADVVRVETGELPGDGQLLAEVQDANVGVYDGAAGDVATVLDADGGRTSLAVSGRGRTLVGGEVVQDEDLVVFYATVDTVARLGGDPAVGELALRLHDTDPEAARATVGRVEQVLDGVPGFHGLSQLPEIRAAGDWPGRADTETFAELLGVITVLALLSAVVLVANTMSTSIAEQTREIGVMRAVGARRRQVGTVYLRGAALLGALGAAAGTVLGAVLAWGLAVTFGRQFWAVDVPFGIDPAVTATSLIVGLVAAPLAALPAIRRATRIDVRGALESGGTIEGGGSRLDAVLRRVTILPRAAQIGVRNAGRRPRRSLATAIIVAVAVGNLLAVLALAEAATRATQRSWGDHLEDVEVSVTGPGSGAGDVVAGTPGVAEVEPVLKGAVEVGGDEAFVWGVEQAPLFRYRIVDGRWFTRDEGDAAAPVAVVERNLAQAHGIDVGDTLALTTPRGEAALDVVGIAGNQQEEGTALFVPIDEARRILGRPEGTGTYWVRMTSPAPSTVDRATSALEDRLGARGYEVWSEVRYIAERDEVEANRTLTTTIGVLGFVIIAISMVGLADAMTSNVLERTREIGVLRAVGARARTIRRVFASEGLVLALTGWVAAIPIGLALTRLIVWLVWEIVEVRLPVVFPLRNLPIALVGTVLLALVAMGPPVWRAAHLRPGEALRAE